MPDQSRLHSNCPSFCFKISKASSVYPGAITPSETSRLMTFAVAASQMSDREIKSRMKTYGLHLWHGYKHLQAV